MMPNEMDLMQCHNDGVTLGWLAHAPALAATTGGRP
jgi:hypothetical protein